MTKIVCPSCGNEILVDENINSVQCQCGAVIPNLARVNGEEGFQTTFNLEKSKEQQKKIAKKNCLLFLLIYNFFILVLIGMLVFLIVKEIGGITPIYTIVPVIVIMIIFEIIFLVKFKQFSKNY